MAGVLSLTIDDLLKAKETKHLPDCTAIATRVFDSIAHLGQVNQGLRQESSDWGG